MEATRGSAEVRVDSTDQPNETAIIRGGRMPNRHPFMRLNRHLQQLWREFGDE